MEVAGQIGPGHEMEEKVLHQGSLQPLRTEELLKKRV